MDRESPPRKQRFDIWTTEGTCIEAGCTLVRASQVAQLDEAEIAWAIEEEGRCDTDTITILPEGEAWTPLDEIH